MINVIKASVFVDLLCPPRPPRVIEFQKNLLIKLVKTCVEGVYLLCK